MSRKIIIKYVYIQSWEIGSNVGLLEFGLAKYDLLLLPCPKEMLREYFLNVFHFHPPIPSGYFQKMDKQ